MEYALNAGSQGTCKATGRKLEKGEVRFVCTAGDPQKKIYLSLAAAGPALRPVLEHAGSTAFSPTAFQGLADLAAGDCKAFYEVGAGVYEVVLACGLWVHQPCHPSASNVCI